MTNNQKRAIVFLAVAAILLILVVILPRETKDPAVNQPPSDLGKHPIYSTYVFPKDEKIINFGVQPLWIFASNTAEIMMRDAIFHQSLRELGLGIRFHAFLKGNDLNFFIRGGELDGGMAGDMPTIVIASDRKVIIPASIGNGYASIIADRHLLIGELEGVRIGYAFGSSAHHVLLEALASEGLNEDKVDLISMDGNKMSDALGRRSIEAFCSWEPITSISLKRNAERVVIHRGRYLGFTYFLESFAEKHPEAIRQILAAEVRAVRWMMRDRRNLLLSGTWVIQRSKEGFGQVSRISPDQLAAMVTEVADINSDFVIPQSDLRENGHLHGQFEFLKSLGKIPQARPWKAVREKFDRVIIKEILRNPIKYRLNEFSYETGKSDE